MSSRLVDKIVLVTGASKGIGRALAIGCAREGAHLIINYNSDREGAESTAAEVESLGRRAITVQADIGRVRQIDQMFVRSRKAFPRLDVLINNAGLTGWSALFDTTEEAWDVVLDTNLKGTFFCSLAAARWMRETKTAGAIVNVSTNCAQLGVKNLVAYATSKAGVHGMTKQLAVELAPYGIRVNTFAPGPTNVDRNLKDDPDYRKVWGGVTPLGRTAEPEEMVGPALFLASSDSSYMTGQTFYVDGGWTVQGKIPASNMEKAARKNRK
ncbi:MAG: 3-oxoacyl-ACP reductase family protein [Opitutaceae bacterium]|nr:3-oxoacyl-ACP reductase family protein [Opitutaceae bacterium]